MKIVLGLILLAFGLMILDSAWLNYRDNRKQRHNRRRQFTAAQLKGMLK